MLELSYSTCILIIVISLFRVHVLILIKNLKNYKIKHVQGSGAKLLLSV